MLDRIGQGYIRFKLQEFLMKKSLSFSIDAAFLTDLARQWFWDEKCEELLMCCIDSSDILTADEKRHIYQDIIKGRKKLVGVNECRNLFSTKLAYSRICLAYARQTLSITYISAHLYDNLRLEGLSQHCGLFRRSLSIKFKAEVGCGIPEYIHKEKLREARYLLTNTDYTLADIAEFLNYPTQSHFTQIFRKYEGCTPQQYCNNPHGAVR